jgi:hypothetical protein
MREAAFFLPARPRSDCRVKEELAQKLSPCDGSASKSHSHACPRETFLQSSSGPLLPRLAIDQLLVACLQKSLSCACFND